MLNKAHAESPQIPLFEDLAPIPAPQELALEGSAFDKPEPLQLSFHYRFPVSMGDMIARHGVGGVVVDIVNHANWRRTQLLKRAAFYTSSQSVKQVLDFCAFQAQGDTRPEVIEFLAEKIIAAHEDLKRVQRPIRPVKMENSGELNEWPGIKTTPGTKRLVPIK